MKNLNARECPPAALPRRDEAKEDEEGTLHRAVGYIGTLAGSKPPLGRLHPFEARGLHSHLQ
ncbi:hypothetical protein Ct61P_04823 [Colletotrichum tofieldiae]|nr:hypothetical protein Ct61P_04823 [Colletotrichum tofieldiae]